MPAKLHNSPFPQLLSSKAILCTPICLATNKPHRQRRREVCTSLGVLSFSYPQDTHPPTFRDKQRPVGPSSSHLHFLRKDIVFVALLSKLAMPLAAPIHPAPETQASLLLSASPGLGCSLTFPKTPWYFWLLPMLSQNSVGLRRGSRVIIKAKVRQALTAFHNPLPRASIFPLH